MLYGNKKEWSINTCYNVDKLWKYDAKQKKPDTKGNILYDSIHLYIDVQNRQIHMNLLFK